MPENKPKPDECIWYPTWAKPHRRAITIALQRRFNEYAVQACNQKDGIQMDTDTIYYYALESEVMRAHRSYENEDPAETLMYVLSERDGGTFLSAPDVSDENLFVVSEKNLKNYTYYREVYSEEHECTLIYASNPLEGGPDN